jgi:hypothetical protein
MAPARANRTRRTLAAADCAVKAPAYNEIKHRDREEASP